MSTVPGETLAATLGLPSAAVTRSGGGAFARSTVDVPVEAWVPALIAARDTLECDFFDWLGAVDLGGPGFQVVAHVWSTAHRYGLLVRTQVPPDAPTVPSIVAVYAGAAWHEREAYEMFGVDFPGHPGLTRLLLAPEFEGHPLRKDFVLASRVVKPWPGAVEPGESAAEAAAAEAARNAEEGQTAGPGSRRGRRQPQRPPGVPAPGEWGPR